MHIDKKLNIVFTVETAKGLAHVHATPLGTEAFDRCFMVIAKTYAVLTTLGLFTSGPRIAAKLLRREAEAMGPQAEAEATAFFAEIRRLTTVIVMAAEGWRSLPLQVAQDQGLLDFEELVEVDNIAAFFTCYSAMLPRDQLQGFVHLLANACHGQAVSSTSMEYAVSLRTSMQGENTGEKLSTSSVLR